MGELKFTEGDTFEYLNEEGILVWQSGLHLPDLRHFQAVVCYGSSEIEAKERRDFILAALVRYAASRTMSAVQVEEVCHRPVCDDRCSYPSCMGPPP